MTPTSLTPYSFEGNEVRIVTGDDGEPRFVASDICTALEIGNSRQALARLDDDEKDVITIDTPGGKQQAAVVTESGLFALILTSRKSEAKRFKKWITSEVLPSIRKTGTYAPTLTPAELLLYHAQRLVDHERRMAEQANSIKRIEARIDAADQKGQFFTVRAYGNIVERHFDDATCQKLSVKCRKYSLAHGYEIGKIKDPKWGYLKTYHETVLQAVFADYSGQWPLTEDE